MQNDIDLLQKVAEQLDYFESKMIENIHLYDHDLEQVHELQIKSATNLIKYLTLRSHDIKVLQHHLHRLGLSSLASSEGHIHRQIQSIRQRLGKTYTDTELDKCDDIAARESIQSKNELLFGTKEKSALPYIMVTFDKTFLEDYPLIKDLLLTGMNVARINCSHDDIDVWNEMIKSLKAACTETDKSCKIYMDLAGPKIRTKIINKGRKQGKVKIDEGDIIWLAENNAGFKKKDIVIHPNEEGIIYKIKKGDRIFIDDGVVKGIATFIKKDRIGVLIERISSAKKQIKEGKGLNFPDTTLDMTPLTPYDISCLPFVCKNADLVGYSFIHAASDVSLLNQKIKEISTKIPKLILKIETNKAVENLPEILLEGMKNNVFGIMIARGDLAVEIGFERTGEIQEEILWICEAAHVPVVWATQVLETLNKSGLATRSEITDAGQAAQAECVMINKGPHTIKVLKTLTNILERSGEHRVKKRFVFRSLSIARKFFDKK